MRRQEVAGIFFFLISSVSFVSSANVVLVTGGAGYIGSPTVLYLLQNGCQVVVIDKKLPNSSFFATSKKVSDLSKLSSLSFTQEKEIARNVTFIQTDFADTETLEYLFTNHPITAVIHFAGFIEAGISVKNPAAFYENNVQKSITLLETMRKCNVKHIIFSSSASVYGLPKAPLITEGHPKDPMSPYGNTKYIIDMLLEDYARAYGFKAISLRYFNAAGGLPEYDMGEHHDPETHVIPLLLRAAYTGKPFYIFGNDYQTPDKTCVRDYLHIYDLAQAHYLALRRLDTIEAIHEVFNLGTGKGHSVKQLITCAEQVTGIKINAQVAARRPGDPDLVVADSTKAQKVLGWKPACSSLENILLSAHCMSKAEK